MAKNYLFRMAALPFIVLVRLYQLFISPVIGPVCRFAPSCSEYAIESITKHGVIYGIFLAGKRLCKCHPFGGHGHDPVPEKITKG